MLQSPKEKKGIPNLLANELRALGENQTQAIVDAHVARDPDAVWGANSLYLGQKHAEKAISADPDNYLRFSKIYHEENKHRISITLSSIGANSTSAEQAYNGNPELYRYMPIEVRWYNIDKAFAHDVKNIEHIPKHGQTALMAEIVLDKAPELYYSLAKEHQSPEKLEIAVNKSPGLLNDIAFKGDLLQECYPKFKSATRDNVEVAKMAVTLDPSLYLKTSPRLQKDPEFFKFTLEAAKAALNMGAPVNTDYRRYPRIIQQSDIVANEAAKTRAYLGNIENIAVLLNAYKKDSSITSHFDQSRFQDLDSSLQQLNKKYAQETDNLSLAQQIVYAREKEISLLLEKAEGIPFSQEKINETVANIKGWRGASDYLLPSERWEVWLTEKGKEPDLKNAKAVPGLEEVNPQKGFQQKTYEEICKKIEIEPYGRDSKDRDNRIGALHLANFFEKDSVSVNKFLENTLKQEISSLKDKVKNKLNEDKLLDAGDFDDLSGSAKQLTKLALSKENTNLKGDVQHLNKLNDQINSRIDNLENSRVVQQKGINGFVAEWTEKDTFTGQEGTKMERMLFCQARAIEEKILPCKEAISSLELINHRTKNQANLRLFSHLAEDPSSGDGPFKANLKEALDYAKEIIGSLKENGVVSGPDKSETFEAWRHMQKTLTPAHLLYLAATYDEVRQLPGIVAPLLSPSTEPLPKETPFTFRDMCQQESALAGLEKERYLFDKEDQPTAERTNKFIAFAQNIIDSFDKIPVDKIVEGYREAMNSAEVKDLITRANNSFNISNLIDIQKNLYFAVDVAENYAEATKDYPQYIKENLSSIVTTNPHKETAHDVARKTAEAGCNLQGWRSLVVQAPQVLKFASSFQKIEVELGQIPKNFAEAKDTYIKIAYPKELRDKDPEFTSWCARHEVDAGQFEAAFNFKAKSEFTLPAISALLQDKDNKVTYKAHFLEKDDRTALFMGEATRCCQSLGNAGEAAALSAFTDKTTGTWVVTDAENKIIAQSWVREGTSDEGKKTLLMDSIESVYKSDKMVGLVAEFVRDFSAQAREKGYDVQIAQTGYGMTNDVSSKLGMTPKDAKLTLIPFDSSTYSDADEKSYSMSKLHERTQSVQPFDTTIARQAQEEKASMVGNLITAMENKGMGITAGYAEKLIDASLKSGDSKSLITVEGANLGKMQDFGTKKFSVPAGDILKIAGVSSEVIDKTLSASATVPLRVSSAKELQAQLDAVKGLGTKAVGPSAPAATIRAELSLDR